MNHFLIETPRLGLRPLTPNDSLDFFELNNDPEVIRYTGDPPFSDLEEARSFLENYDQYERYGYGRWAVILKKTGEFIGWCGLKFMPDLDETDLGFRFFRKHWNKGYATESAMACIEYGFGKLGLKRIVGRAMEANKASVKVLEKTGFHFLKKIDFEEHPGLYFYLDYYEMPDPENGVQVRVERPEDFEAIFEVNMAAFGQEGEGILVNRIRQSENFVDGLSLVAEAKGTVVGHILFSKIEIVQGERRLETIGLAPMSVLPAWQGKGVGKKLVKAGLHKVKSLGFDAVIVLGHEAYYPKFGFQRASKFGIFCPFEVPDAAFMAIELIPGSLSGKGGTVCYPPAFEGV